MQALGRAVQRGERSAGRRLHPLDRGRCARSPLDDLAGSIAHVRGLGRAGLLTDDEVDGPRRGARRAPRRGRGRDARLGPVARGRPPQPRGGARRPDRAARRQAPHRPVAERPGRDRPPPLDCGGRSTSSTPAIVGLERALVGLAEREGDAVLPGTTHHPARPAGPVRPSPARLRRDARARPRAAGRLPPPGERLAARCRGAGRGRLPARSRGHGPRARLRRRDGELARRRLRPGLRRSSSWPRPRSRWSISAGSRRSSPGGRTRPSGSSGWPTRSRPAAR